MSTGGKRLYRSRTDRVIGGVLGGFANWIGWDPTWVRIGYVLIAVVTGFWTGAVVYVIAMIVVPEEPVDAPQQPSWPQGVGTPAPPPPPTWTQPEPGSTETVQSPPAPPAS
ncbi:MAG: PspC domain-containing protein [Actinobacteria bacterium]|nr:MAG: PspC domain-containing protein [Actinomycetota bacterium]